MNRTYIILCIFLLIFTTACSNKEDIVEDSNNVDTIITTSEVIEDTTQEDTELYIELPTMSMGNGIDEWANYEPETHPVSGDYQSILDKYYKIVSGETYSIIGEATEKRFGGSTTFSVIDVASPDMEYHETGLLAINMKIFKCNNNVYHLDDNLRVYYAEDSDSGYSDNFGYDISLYKAIFRGIVDDYYGIDTGEVNLTTIKLDLTYTTYNMFTGYVSLDKNNNIVSIRLESDDLSYDIIFSTFEDKTTIISAEEVLDNYEEVTYNMYLDSY